MDSTSGLVGLSAISVGDRVRRVNGRKLGPSCNAATAARRLRDAADLDGYVSIETGACDGGDDVLVQATVIKPDPRSTCENLGIDVWTWGVLCIKSIEKDSLFARSALKGDDVVASINDIDCNTVTPDGFRHIVQELPHEISIVAIRGKERWTGKFG